MREYINVYQLDELDSNNIRFDDYLLVSQDALSYKFGVGRLRDFVIDGIDTTLPVYNANQLLGYGLEFTEPLSNHQLLTFDETSNSWINKELDINAVFRFEEFEPTKFLRLDNEKNVITSDVYISDLVVDTPDMADHVLMVADNGSDVIYVDIFDYINTTIDTKSDTFIPLLNAEIDRATGEESRIESMLNNEIQRYTNEDVRIENKFDTIINDEIGRLDSELGNFDSQFNTDLQNEIDRATSEETRIENKFDTLVGNETTRAVDEERRLEQLINGVLNSTEQALQEEIDRATSEETRIENKFDGITSSQGNQLNSHINNFNNPHNVNAADLNLENVLNYDIASEAEARAGDVNNKYMTPLRSRQNFDTAFLETVTNGFAMPRTSITSRLDFGSFNSDPCYIQHTSSGGPSPGNAIFRFCISDDATTAGDNDLFQFGAQDANNNDTWVNWMYVNKDRVWSRGDMQAFSDGRVKENFRGWDDPLEMLVKMRGGVYDRTDIDVTQVGVIAQEMVEVLPEVVGYDENEDTYSVAYGNLTAFLIETCKSLLERIEKLESERDK